MIVGKEYWVSDTELKYIGIYRVPVQQFLKESDLNLIHCQAEFLSFSEHGQSMDVCGEADEYLLPIASETPENCHIFDNNGQISQVVQMDSRHFNYYRVKNQTHICSAKKAYYGNAIPLGHKLTRKKLVLSFFVDGLSQEVLNGTDFQKLMPNTYRFFSKGTICTQVFSGAEWTYPSLATYETGLNTLNHMMFHNAIDSELPRNIPILSEYFKREGYYTSKIDGDWRSAYHYGYTRGVDQYIYQHQSMGARAEQEIMNVIEHLEAFKETDQYLWMCIGDLHDVADEYDLSLAVQSTLTLEEREYEDSGNTSVKQNFSEKKIKMYKKTITYLDMLFGLFYSYLENNYNDDEFVISLFADHGQGYLIPPNKNFLSEGRTKVAFMFRGGEAKSVISDEIISTADYLPIMCKLTGIKQDDVVIDGQLPKIFGGKSEREFAITDSIHPGDPYLAVANTKEYAIYFENPEKTDEEGRFRLGEYTVQGFYKNGDIVSDKNLLHRYEEIFLNRIAERIIYD